jgi:thiamine-phosphate pyrophosphorylase
VQPVICLVTDRRRLPAGSEAVLVEHIAAAARAGVHLIQIRERDLDARALTRVAAAAVDAVRGTATRILVNDRTDVALASGAHGVHLRGDSAPARRIRAIVPQGFLIGRSVHSREEAERAAAEGGLDYLMFGTVFETASKPGVRAAGPATLAAIASSVTLPVLAIGGVTVSRMAEVAEAGAAGFGAIGLFGGCPPDRLQVVVREASLAFDTLSRVP